MIRSAVYDMQQRSSEVNFLRSNYSPFLVLWHFYLIFFSVVLLTHIVCAVVSRILRRQVNALYKSYNVTHGLSDEEEHNN